MNINRSIDQSINRVILRELRLIDRVGRDRDGKAERQRDRETDRKVAWAWHPMAWHGMAWHHHPRCLNPLLPQAGVEIMWRKFDLNP